MGGLLDQWQPTGLSRVPIYCSHGGNGKYPCIDEAVQIPGVLILPVCISCTCKVFREVGHQLHGAAALTRTCPNGIHIHPFIVRAWCAGSCWTHTNPPPLPCHHLLSHPSNTPALTIQPNYHPPQVGSHPWWSTEVLWHLRNPNPNPNPNPRTYLHDYYTYSHVSKATQAQEDPQQRFGGVNLVQSFGKICFYIYFPFFATI